MGRKILEFLRKERESGWRKKRREDDVIKWNVSAEVLKPAGEKVGGREEGGGGRNQPNEAVPTGWIDGNTW